MFEFKTGDIFTSQARMLVNPTNFEGPMGGGLARQFSIRFPGLEAAYIKGCQEGKNQPGYISIACPENGPKIVNFPTMHLGQPARMEYIRQGLVDLRIPLLRLSETMRVAVPKLGCGIGGLDWQEVRKAILDTLEGVSCTVEIWE